MSVAVIGSGAMELVAKMERVTIKEPEVVLDARSRLASRVRKISDEGRKLVTASIARIAKKLGHNRRGNFNEFWKRILRLNFSDKQSLLPSKLLNVKRGRDDDLRQRRRQFDLDGGVFVKDKCILPSN